MKIIDEPTLKKHPFNYNQFYSIFASSNSFSIVIWPRDTTMIRIEPIMLEHFTSLGIKYIPWNKIYTL